MDKNTKFLLSTELPAIYKDSYRIEIQPKWLEQLKKYEEEFLIEP